MRWSLSTSRHSSFLASCLAALVVSLAVLPVASAQSIPGTVQQRATESFHGTDQQGKDGPLAKMGMSLTRLYAEYDAHKASGAKRPFVPTNKHMPARGGYVSIDAVAKQDAARLLTALQALGLKGGAASGPMVSGRLPIEAIPDAAALADLRFARPARAMTFTGSVTSQGDAAVDADGARMLYGVDGSGTTVGVISDSYDTDGGASTAADGDVDTEDLPGASDNSGGYTTSVDVLEDYGDDPGEDNSVKDEGRAMLQIIHDLAPGAALQFHTALGGQASFAQAIRNLADAGSDIIVDDILYLREPMFQDGVIAQAVDDVKLNDGVAYFSAAGNLADQSWEEGFIGSGQDGPLGDGGGELHRFDGASTCQSITVPDGKTITFIFQWDEPYASAGTGNPGSTSDIDIFVRDKTEGAVIVSSEDDNIDNDPIEILDFENDGSMDADGDGTIDTAFCFGIELQEGSGPGLMKYVYGPGPPRSDGISVANEGEATLYGHANAKGAEAVAASSYGSTKTPRSYTALGGVPIIFDTEGNRQQDDTSRQKPGVTAPDCVSNTFFGSSNTFCGTSAAAPHAAAVAALMMENRPDLTVDELFGELRSTASDVTAGGATAGVDKLTGAGFIDASDATLPVELVAFDAVADDQAVLLTWETASETNNAGFRVEQRSAGGPFESIAFVPGAGTTTETQTYQHRATGLAPGVYTFRLQQIDTDGTVHTSPEVEVALSLDTPFALSAAYPNPARSAVHLDLTVRRTQAVRAIVHDALGRHVRTLHNGPVNANEPLSLALQAETLPSGMYLIQVRGESFSATRRVTVVH